MKNYETMSKTELRLELDELTTLLADTEEDRDFVLGQSGNHVPGSFVKRFAAEIDDIKDRMETVKRLIG